MQSKNMLKNILSGLLMFSLFLLAGCSTSDITNIAANGNAMSNSNVKLKPINQDKVKLYYAGNATPKHYRVVGRVSAEIYNLVGLEHTQSSIADELKKQAASIGANAVIDISSGMAQVTGDAVVAN